MLVPHESTSLSAMQGGSMTILDVLVVSFLVSFFTNLLMLWIYDIAK